MCIRPDAEVIITNSLPSLDVLTQVNGHEAQLQERDATEVIFSPAAELSAREWVSEVDRAKAFFGDQLNGREVA